MSGMTASQSSSVARRVADLDWRSLTSQLDEQGFVPRRRGGSASARCDRITLGLIFHDAA